MITLTTSTYENIYGIVLYAKDDFHFIFRVFVVLGGGNSKYCLVKRACWHMTTNYMSYMSACASVFGFQFVSL